MPTIEFNTFNEQTLKDTKPILAKSVTPDWWKNMKFQEYNRGISASTIRACPAMDDWLKSGWYLCANRDMIVKNGHIDDNDDGQFVGSQEFGDGWETPSPHHPAAQVGYAFQYLHDDEAPVRSAFKFRNAWNITTPPGYSTMYLDTEVLIYWLLLHIIAASIYPLSGAVNFYHIFSHSYSDSFLFR